MGTISSLLLGTLATTAISCGIVFTNEEGIVNLGYMFKEYCDRKSAELFATIEGALALNSALGANNLVEVDATYLAEFKEFLDGLFNPSKEYNPDANYVGTALGIPVYEIEHVKALGNIGDAEYSINNQGTAYLSNSAYMLGLMANLRTPEGKLASNAGQAIQTGDFKCYCNYVGSTASSTAYLVLNNGEWQSLGHGYNIATNVVDSHRIFLARAYDGTTFSYSYDLWYGYQVTDTSLYSYLKATAVGILDHDIGIGYTGTYEWDDTLNDVKTDEDDGTTSIPLPIPGDIGDLVGVGKDNLTDGSIDTPTDGTIGGITGGIIDVTDTTIDIEGEGEGEGEGEAEGEIDTSTDIVIPPSPMPPIPPVPNVPDIEITDGGDGEIDEEDNDKLTTTSTDVTGGLYYYYIGTDVADNTIDDVLGHATGIVSLSYTPYLWYTDCNITKLPYDTERFSSPISIGNFSVYRINDVTRPIKKVGGFKAYANDFSVNIGPDKPYSYMNETKLYQYPYSFAYVYDGINSPLEIKYHYLKFYYNDVYIKQTVSDKCTYGMFVLGYKGDTEGNLESMVLTSGNELPCSSNMYAQWYATNRNQIAQNIQNIQNTNAIQNHGNIQQYDISKDSNLVNGIGQAVGAIASIFSLDFGQTATGIGSAINTVNVMRSQKAQLNTNLALNKQSEQNAIQMAMAQNADMRNSPATLVSHGSNVFYGLVNNNKSLLLIRMGLNDEDYYRIGTYFTMYGYKQNRVLDINLRSRKYFNYFKIVAPNIVAPNVPSAHLEKIKSIFKEGITLWHYNNSPKVLDYFHSDNYEV